MHGARRRVAVSVRCVPRREPLQRRYFGETRRSGDEYNDLRELHRIPHTRIYFLIFPWPFSRYFLRTFHEPSMAFPKIGAICGIHMHFAEFWGDGTEIFPLIQRDIAEIFRYTENTEPS